MKDIKSAKGSEKAATTEEDDPDREAEIVDEEVDHETAVLIEVTVGDLDLVTTIDVDECERTKKPLKLFLRKPGSR